MENNKLLIGISEKELEEKIELEKIEHQQRGLSTTLPHNVEYEIVGYPTLDNILNLLGYTNYHIILIFGCCCFYFSAGAQLYAFNLLMPIFNDLLKLNKTLHIITISSCYLGYAFGSFFVGILTKNYDRKMPLLVTLTIYALFSVLIVFYQNLMWIIACRFVIGACIGIATSLYISNLSEYLPMNYRELAFGMIICNNAFGIISYMLMFKLIMPDYEQFNRWKLILLLVSVPCIFSCVFGMFIIRDSPRLLLNKDRFIDAIIEIRILANNSLLITNEQEEDLKKEVIAVKLKHVDFSFSLLFSSKFFFLTTVNLLLLLTSSCIFVSNTYTLPLVLYKEQKNHSEIFLELIFAQSFTIISIILAVLVSGVHNFGIKYTIFIGFISCFVTSLFTSILQVGLIPCSSVINLLILGIYFLSKVYLIESFPSKLRDHGLSVIFVIVRFGESLCPTICELLFNWYDYGPLILISILSLIGAIFAYLIPFETKGHNLDTNI